MKFYTILERLNVKEGPTASVTFTPWKILDITVEDAKCKQPAKSQAGIPQ